MEAVEEGDEFMAVTPWKSQFRAPSNWKQPANRQKEKPYIDVDLEWVHGY